MKTDLRSELELSARMLRTLRDEIRVQLHLGSLDAQKEWRQLEPRLESALDRVKTDVSEASRAMIDELRAKLGELRDRLH